MKKQGAFSGALILAASGFIVKILGALFKIPLGAMLGPEGNGIFSIAYNIYALAFVVATAGIPVAMSKTVAEIEALGQNSKVILKKAVLLFGVAGGFLSLILFCGADRFGAFMGADSAGKAVRAISPAVLFVSVAAILRGYFQGRANMVPTGISQIIEAAFKLVFGIFAVYILQKAGEDKGMLATGATFGVTQGAMISMIYLLFKCKQAEADNTLNPRRGAVRSLIKTALPITLGASIVSLSNVIDSGLIMNVLTRGGMETSDALWNFGAYNYAATIFNLPGFLVTTLGLSLVPTVTSAGVMGKYREMSDLCESSLSVAMAVAFGAAGGLFALSEPILALLYQGVEYRAVEVSARLLMLLSAAVPFLSFSTLSASVLQALGDVKGPMYAMGIGAALKVIFNYILVGMPGVNIYGAAISTVICYVVTCGINVFFLFRRGELSVSFYRILLRPTLFGVIPTLGAKFTYMALLGKYGNLIALFTGGACGILLWIACILLFLPVKQGDIKQLFNKKTSPFFQKITKK